MRAFFLKLLFHLFAVLPLPVAHAFGSALGWLLILVPNKRRRTATTNLELSGQQVNYVSAGGVSVHRKNLAETIGTRAHSRLFEMCRQVRIFDVEDFRQNRGRRG